MPSRCAVVLKSVLCPYQDQRLESSKNGLSPLAPAAVVEIALVLEYGSLLLFEPPYLSSPSHLAWLSNERLGHSIPTSCFDPKNGFEIPYHEILFRTSRGVLQHRICRINRCSSLTSRVWIVNPVRGADLADLLQTIKQHCASRTVDEEIDNLDRHFDGWNARCMKDRLGRHDPGCWGTQMRWCKEHELTYFEIGIALGMPP